MTQIDLIAAARPLVLNGKHESRGVTYRIRPRPHGGYAAHTHGEPFHANGGASYGGPSYSAALEWLLRRIAGWRVCVWVEPIDPRHARSDCPLGCGYAQRTSFLRDTWIGCGHFVHANSDNRAVFVAYRSDIRACWSCDEYTPDEDDVCVRCGAHRSADPAIDEELRLDERMERHD